MTALPQDPDFSDINRGASSSAFQEYTVAEGDSLSKLARQFYGDAKLWHLIYEANPELIKNPDLIQIGWTLIIPPKP